MDYIYKILVGEDIYVHKYEEKSSEKLDLKEEKESKDINELTPLEMKWHYFLLHITAQILGLYGLYLCITEAKWQTIVFTLILDALSMIGVMGGGHRLWSHRSYKAKLPLRIFYAFLFTLSAQESIFTWVLNHRIHHKYVDTNADPHNAKRGFWYSHLWWTVTKRTEDFKRKIKTIDMSDLKADPVIQFQWKYYFPLSLLIAIFLPFFIPVWFWGENLITSYAVAVSLRLFLTLNQTFSINSIAHKIGSKPYNENILATENSSVAVLAFGEGFHNFHHTFPWDYSTSEFGIKLNLTTLFIDLMAWLGLATNRKTVAKSLIETRKRRNEEESIKKFEKNGLTSDGDEM